MNAQTINTIIFIFGVFIAVFAALYIIFIVKQRLPEHTRVALEQFARQAVWQVEQQSGSLSGPAKKELAVASAAKLFAAFGLPAPPAIAVDIAIEAAVYLLRKSNNPTPKQSG